MKRNIDLISMTAALLVAAGIITVTILRPEHFRESPELIFGSLVSLMLFSFLLFAYKINNTVKNAIATQQGQDYNVDRILLDAYGDLYRLTAVVAHLGEYSFNGIIIGDIVIVNGSVYHYTYLDSSNTTVMCIGKPLPIKSNKNVSK